MVLNGRTDIALEAHTLWRKDNMGELEGAELSEDNLEGFPFSCLEIRSDSAAKTLGRDLGRYYTLSLSGHFERGSESFPAAAKAIAELLRRCIGKRAADNVLVAALGNPDITPDALGSLTASNILVTRHLKQDSPESFSDFASVAISRTGVLGTTGIESAAQIKALCTTLKPALIITIDALAGADPDRLCSTVQICDSGIAPGSGVGNSRERLDSSTLHVPVIALGVPTVIDASAFSNSENLSGLFVTPRNIDSTVRCFARVIAYGINLALHPNLKVADIDMLVG